MIVLGIATLLPDIDHPESYISSTSNFAKFVSLKLTKDLTTHRGFFHSIYGAIATTIVAGILLFFLNPTSEFSPLILTIIVFMGYIFYLFGDSLTSSGIYWLDKRNERYHFNGIIRTGSQLEAIFMYALLFVIGYLFLKVGLV